MEVSGYTMDLYCDHKYHDAAADYKISGVTSYNMTGCYYHPTHRGGCLKQARNDGWVFKRNGDVICPKCSNQ